MASTAHIPVLSRKLNALTDQYKQTLQSIHRIPRTPDPEELADLTSDVREALNALDEDTKLLSLELEDLSSIRSDTSQAMTEEGRLEIQTRRLEEDLRNARSLFRRTQLHVKTASRASRLRERSERLSRLRDPPAPAPAPLSAESTPGSSQVLPPGNAARRKGRDTAASRRDETDLELHASADVVDALRQTVTLMSTEVSRSQFATEILTSSTRELERLNESYTDLDAMLKTSKGLVTQLLKSNKSDTWYLITSKWVLLGVLAWLVWRRVLWGPTWWLVWLPLKLLWMSMMVVLAPFGIGRGSVGELAEGGMSMPSAAERLHVPVMPSEGVRVDGAGDGAGDASEDGSLSQKVGRMVEQAARQNVRGDGGVLEDSEEPRNPKKRVLDTDQEEFGAEDVVESLGDQEVEAQPSRDEL